MKENQIFIESCADCTVVIDIPEEHIHKVWTKRGQKYPFDRDAFEQLMYNDGVANLIHYGYLKCEDKEFLENNGMLWEDGTKKVVEMTDAYMKRLIGPMPMTDFKKELVKLQPNQITDLADYAIDHANDLKVDKAELLTKMTGKQILKAITNARADEEG